MQTVGDDLALNPDAITIDVGTFERLLDEGQLEDAVLQYVGPLMDGFHLADSAEFDQWLDSERVRLAQRYAKALESLAESGESRDDFAAAVTWWQRLAAHDPGNGRVAVRLMRALEAAGDRAGALRLARQHTALLRDEFDAAPDPHVSKFAERLRLEPPEPSTAVPSTVPRATVSPAPMVAPVEHIGTVVGAAEGSVEEPVESSSAARGDDREHLPTPPLAPPRRARWALLAVAALLLVVIPLALRGVAAPEKKRSLVVLPFVEMDASRDSAYFGDGLTEELIHALSSAGDLRVTARTSAFQFKGQNLDVREIGRRLGVGLVVEGSVRRGNGRMRITAQLVSATDGTHLWSHTYDRQLDDALAVQGEIARAIAGALRLRLREAASPVARHSADREAYDAYLKGRYALGQRVPGAAEQAIHFFQEAIARDSAYALAFVGLAEAYVSIEDVAGASPDSMLPLARAAAARALAHDSSLAEAHALLGDLHTERWEWDDARREFDRAFALEEPTPRMLIWYSRWLDNLGRFDEALEVTRRAVELDPLSGPASYNYAGSFLHLGRPEPAIVEARRLVALHPTLPLGYDMLGWALVDAKRPAEAIAPLERAVELGGGRWLALANLGRAYAGVGRRDDANAVIARLERDWGRTGYGNFAIAAVHVALGDRARALARVERVYQLRQAKLPHVRQWSAFEPLYGDTAFSRIVRGAGFEAPVGGGGR